MNHYIYILSLSLYFFLFSSLIILILIGKFIGYKGSQLISCMYSFICAYISIYVFILISINNNIVDIPLYNWIKIEFFNINIGLLINPLTSCMLVIITIISFLAQIYSIEYMSSDPHKIRFYLYLIFFTLFMIILVTSNNLLQLFIGWEGVGICSYLLVNFWFTRFKANKSSLLAVIVNKIGDLCLMVAIVLIHNIYKTINFNFINKSSSYLFEFNSIINNKNYIYNIENSALFDKKLIRADIFPTHFDHPITYKLHTSYIFLQSYFINLTMIIDTIEFISLFIIIASIGKSAQFGLHIWLPEAMEGPTPVSSLIHAATMVTAGIFLIIRLSYIFLHVKNILLIIIFFGSITIFISATIAINQFDIKKIIAYSTCSQLGYMFMSCGFFSFSTSIFHLLMHAFFKALLFLTAGYIIHLFSNNQDIRIFQNLIKINPFGYISLGIGSLTIIGTPFLSGFYSKETIIEFITLSNYLFNNYYIILNIVLIFSYYTVQITSMYSLKGLIIIFYNRYIGYKWLINNINYPYIYSILPLFVLSFCSIILGYLTSDRMIGIQTDFWADSFYFTNAGFLNSYIYLNEYNNNIITITELFEENRSVLITWTLYILIIWICIIFNNLYYNINNDIFLKKYMSNNKLKYIYIYITNKYLILNKIIIKNIKLFLNNSLIVFFYLFDKGIIEYFGPYGILLQLNNLIIKIYKIHTGFLYHYLGLILVIVLIFLYSIFLN